MNLNSPMRFRELGPDELLRTASRTRSFARVRAPLPPAPGPCWLPTFGVMMMTAGDSSQTECSARGVPRSAGCSPWATGRGPRPEWPVVYVVHSGLCARDGVTS